MILKIIINKNMDVVLFGLPPLVSVYFITDICYKPTQGSVQTTKIFHL